MVFRKNNRRRGFGALVFLVLTLVAVLFIFAFFQRFVSGLNNQREALSSGRKAYYLAEAAINEALLDFESGINVYSDDPQSWFQKARVYVENNSANFAEKIFIPSITNTLCGDDIDSISVEVVLGAQQSVDQLAYNKVGLLTFTAIVRIPRKMPGLWGKYTTRNVQKCFEVRSMLVTPPRPFDGFTFYMNHWPSLQAESDRFDENKANFDAMSRSLDDSIKTEMEGMRDGIQGSIDFCKQKVEQYEDGMRQIDDVDLWVGSHEVVNGRSASSKSGARRILNEEADKDAIKNGFQNKEEMKLVSGLSANSWMGQAGYTWSSKKVSWPQFRTDGSALSNPVFVDKSPLSSDEMPFNMPPWPDEPTPRPSVQFVSGGGPAFNSAVDWQSNCSNVAAAFSSWCSRWDGTINPYQSGVENELRRHEGVFKLVRDDDVKTFREIFELHEIAAVYLKRASWTFADQAQFEKAIPQWDGRYFLDGIYYIEGSLDLSLDRYVGSGVIVSADTVTMRDSINEGSGCLTVVSGKGMYVIGDPQAALLCPEYGIEFKGNSIRGMASHSTLTSQYNFNINFDPAGASKLTNGNDRMTRFWVNVSPYHVACNFLRN